ncbi:MAG: HAD family hydrolase [Candidatus Altiarchaeota archaeon]|nr:HAD family hydrolase [Candidatus Altiarchaeota archaeon]
MKAKAVFFDIDNTLVRKSTGHKETFMEAIMDIFGFDAKINYSNYTGKVDKGILLDVLQLHGISEYEINAGIEDCLRRMREIYKLKAKQKLASTELIEGVNQTLDALKSRGMVLGLITGNVKVIAFEKLKLAGIIDVFSWGGFGDEGVNRSEVALKAMNRLKEKHNILASEAVVVGDTPTDIIAAKNAGSHAFGVSTGHFSNKELQDAGAEFVTSNIHDIVKVLK